MYAQAVPDDAHHHSQRPGALRDVAREGQFARPERPLRRDYTRPAAAPHDPFFDKPYEASTAAEVAPAWDATVSRRGTRSISANIKPKRRVAALFKAE
jgi:hypothetical protein